MKQCADCRNGEHANYDDNIVLVYVKNPETGKTVKRANLCKEHRTMYLDDGYIVKNC